MKNKKITILHIGYCPNNQTSGVAVAIPNHLKHQSMMSELKIGFLNLCSYYDLHLENVNIFLYEYYKSLKKLPKPFSNPDLIVFHELYRFPFLKLSSEARKSKIPYVIIPHGGLTNSAQKKKKIKKTFGNIFLFNKYIYSASALQFLSSSECVRSKKRIKKQYIIVSGSGIELPTINYKVHNNLRIIFIGRYDIYYKGLDLLLNSLCKIRKELYEKGVIVELYGIGNESDENYINNFVKKHNMGEVLHVHGPVFGENKKTILKHADIFIQPSRSEGQPLGVIEALSYGIPVIITPGTGLANDVENYNFGYVANFNVDNLSKVILTAIEKKQDLYKLSKNARNYAEKKFNWNEIEKKLIDEYYSLLRRL